MTNQQTSSAPEQPSLPQRFCPSPCCAKLELGSLFCQNCRAASLSLLQSAAAGLESELSELPALLPHRGL